MNTTTIDPVQNASLRISIKGLTTFTVDALKRAGLSQTDAQTAAEVLVTTDAWGVFTHGTKCLRGYLRRLKDGGLRATGVPEIVNEGPAWAIVNGNSSLAMITSVFAMRAAMGKAKACGIGYVGVRNSCHFGAAGYYASLAANQGLIGLSMANDVPSVAAPGSLGAITGSNPLSYAIPAGKHRSILLDMSVATVAGGKVYAARTRGEKIPNTWLIDGNGKPTTDPSGYPEVGALQPAAGHKGYGIALLIEILAGVLSGASVTWKIGSWMWGDAAAPTDHGAAFIAIDVGSILPRDAFIKRVESLVDEIHQAPCAEGTNRLFVPGEMEWEKHSRAVREGILLPSDVADSLRDSAAMMGLNLNEFLAS
ncbi:MAG TPA: Ldh family oxidoreductase [Verrucomicrobiae bacterium]|jgi:LDH2 family malate/lactate/ureidoglycolate dehydrogenase|nr:Ldh family oxidoreductase [Verrucomicrobiae bacterium]